MSFKADMALIFALLFVLSHYPTFLLALGLKQNLMLNEHDVELKNHALSRYYTRINYVDAQ